MVDARAAFPLFGFLMHIKLWTFLLAIFFMSFFALLERYGFSVSVFLRWSRAFFAGPKKTSSPWWRK